MPGELRVEQSVILKVCEARGLSEESDYYAVVLLDNVARVRTPTIYKTKSPLFLQEYELTLPSRAQNLSVMIKKDRLRRKPTDPPFVGIVRTLHTPPFVFFLSLSLLFTN
jgi:hypothetical protein